MDLPTLVVTVRRGFPSDDALLGISFRTMATVLSAALESFPYNSEINNDLRQDSWTTSELFAPIQGDLTEKSSQCVIAGGGKGGEVSNTVCRHFHSTMAMKRGGHCTM